MASCSRLVRRERELSGEGDPPKRVGENPKGEFWG